jgi:hypothetical protein
MCSIFIDKIDIYIMIIIIHFKTAFVPKKQIFINFETAFSLMKSKFFGLFFLCTLTSLLKEVKTYIFINAVVFKQGFLINIFFTVYDILQQKRGLCGDCTTKQYLK